MARRPILAANWKMQKTVGEALAFAGSFLPLVKDAAADVVLAPPATALHALGQAIQGSNVALAAQNVSPEPKGAFTGELSTEMLADVGCSYAIVGHSERRTLFGETSAFVAAKAEALLAQNILPIVCCGESLEQREANQTFSYVGGQIRESLARIDKARAAEIVVAYEPIWAIGTGKTATPEMAQEVHAMIRGVLGELFGADGEAIRIQYGGSVKPANVAELMSQTDIDGALVGGASLEPESFSQIVNFGG
ncbi:MAG: triose-phosphate isomerase [Deltaproteobacteria bacterium]|nr:triose-phosphate isomerase [Deltaproteobacteria bacterium]MBW2393596.1 triose-phosphate isomerase [Deltaproteobacteria bacterium]